MQGIVIQGPTNYYKQVIPCYKDISNVVWSTWVDEPKDNIDYIRDNGIEVILNEKPTIPSYLNVNFQAISTYNGVKYLKDKGVTEVLKIRGDVQVNDLKILLNKLKGKEMAFLAIAKEGIRKDIYYELVYPHYSHDYPVDLVIYGSITNMINSFNFIIEQFTPIPPEALIAYHFLEGLKKEFILTYSHFIKNNVYFYLNDCVENNIKMIWLKNNFDLVQSHNSKQLYDF